MSMTNAFGVDDFAKLSAEEQVLIRRRERVLGPAYRLFYERPIHFVRGDGVWLYDQNGRSYLDAYNNVASIGHGNTEVLQAINQQSEILNTHTRYLHENILEYAENLIATFPDDLSQVMFTCTGSEANDLAVRIAKKYTGGTGIIVTQHAYHGVTQTVSEFSPSLGASVDLGAHVRTINAPGTGVRAGETVEQQFTRDVQAAINDLLRHGIKPAMLIVDTIFSSDGVIPNPTNFLKSAVDAIHKAGGIFVADEVQPGFGRTGDAMWGFMRHGISPDIVTLGKPMGNGYPLAGLVAKPEVLAEFGRTARYFNTYGGNPVAAAAGQAVLSFIKHQDLINNAKVVGTYLINGLASLKTDHAELGDLRGAGLFVGLDIHDKETGVSSAQEAARIVNGLRERGVLISATGLDGNVLKIRPPLIFTKENADMFLEKMRETLIV